jgi:hypothetical protein
MNNEPLNKNGITECILVSYDNTNGKDNSVLLVGRKHSNKPVEIINAFQNKEADDLWKKLTTKKNQEK